MPTPPSASSPPPEDGGTSIEDAQETVDAVVIWYSRQLRAAWNSGDQERQEELTALMQEAGEDRQQLGDAGPEEIDRLAALYTERLQDLQGEGD